MNTVTDITAYREAQVIYGIARCLESVTFEEIYQDVLEHNSRLAELENGQVTHGRSNQLCSKNSQKGRT